MTNDHGNPYWNSTASPSKRPVVRRTARPSPSDVNVADPGRTADTQT
jgi:hypothetical protein